MENIINQTLQEGISFHGNGNLKEALRCYNDVLRVNPKHADANHNMGVLGLGVGKPEHSLSFFKTALEVNPKMRKFWISYIDVLIKLNQKKEAKLILDKAKLFLGKESNLTHLEEILNKKGTINSKIFNNNESEETLENKINNLIQLYHKGEFTNVLNVGNQIIKTHSTSAILFNLIGASYSELKQFKLAIENFKISIKINPHDASILNNIGVAQLNLGQPQESIKSYTHALKVDEKYTPSYINLGNVYKELNNLKLSVENFQKAIDLEPANANIYLALGSVLNMQGDHDAAISIYKKGVLLNPNYETELSLAEMCIKKKENFQEALIFINKVLEKKPMDARANAYKTVALRGLKKFKKVQKLINFSNLVKVENIQNFSNDNISTFNKNFLSSLMSHPRRAAEKNIQGWAIRGGTVIRNLFDDGNSLVKTFESLLRRAIDSNISKLPYDSKHPFLMKKPRSYKLDCWANFLEEGDFQSNHIHNNGWAFV